MAKIPTYQEKPQKSSGTAKLSGSSGIGQALAGLGQQVQNVGQLMNRLQEVKDLKITNNYESAYKEKRNWLIEYAYGVHEDENGNPELNVPLGERADYIEKGLENYKGAAEHTGDFEGLSQIAKEELDRWHKDQTEMVHYQAKAKDMQFELESAIVSQETKVSEAQKDLYKAKWAEDKDAIKEAKAKLEEQVKILAKLSGPRSAKEFRRKGYFSLAREVIQSAETVPQADEAWERLDKSKLTSAQMSTLHGWYDSRVRKIRTTVKTAIDDLAVQHGKGEDVSELLPDVKNMVRINFDKKMAKKVIRWLDSLRMPFEEIKKLPRYKQDAAMREVAGSIDDFLKEDDPEKQEKLLADLLEKEGMGESKKSFLISKMLEHTDVDLNPWLKGFGGTQDTNGFTYLASLYKDMAETAGTTDVYSDFFENWEKLATMVKADFEGFTPEGEELDHLTRKQKAVHYAKAITTRKRAEILEEYQYRQLLGTPQFWDFKGIE